MKRLLLLLLCVISLPAMAEDTDSGIRTVDEILKATIEKYPTPCASDAFSSALYINQDEIDENEDEDAIRLWAQSIMFKTETLEAVLSCDEIKQITDDTKTIAFSPITLEFDNVRTITINYTTQKKVLKDKYVLSKKRSLPDGNPNPKLMDPNDPAIYINTDPSWYAIMVVQHGTLSQFVGKNKNNTVSLQYIYDNIDTLYPAGYHCTSKTALALDSDTINQAVHKVANIEGDSNDYYVAGDKDLRWIMWAEIAGDVALTVLTMGTSSFVEGAIKYVRVLKALPKIKNTMKALRQLPKVQKFIEVSGKIVSKSKQITDLGKQIKNSEKYTKLLKKAEKAKNAGKFDDAAKFEKQANNVLERSKKIDKSMNADKLKNTENLQKESKQLKQEAKQLEDEAKTLEKESSDVKKYKENSEAFSDAMEVRRSLRGVTRPQTGNMFSKTFKAYKALKSTTKMDKAARVARKGMSGFSSKAKYWLTDQTLKHAARFPSFVTKFSTVYGVAKVLGDMWDQTSTTSQEFTNGIEFKPWLLLSADDLEGQENVVNYGMWFMWGAFTDSEADDDAAYLQATDMASKVHLAIQDQQNENDKNCYVDIYVVHPIIRLDESNPENTKGELFYLIMNDEPFTTAHQFEGINVQAWIQEQQRLEREDPEGKYKKPDEDEEKKNQ